MDSEGQKKGTNIQNPYQANKNSNGRQTTQGGLSSSITHPAEQKKETIESEKHLRIAGFWLFFDGPARLKSKKLCGSPSRCVG